ncbi:hypothetical protein QNI19_31855 [Cytophagaceae bacterium DM2B3-1]|uniref:Uncharacterized protein n=1 Tax=Xanthocytophaga flava TaxID=3048013 RepID=A0ABT7CV09_9BACT|nr:hypothetical protein [Xanthocytophaga flavus]MDJ1497577.1 hypothetical protein [Xanthocytophaga flavus]
MEWISKEDLKTVEDEKQFQIFSDLERYNALLLEGKKPQPLSYTGEELALAREWFWEKTSVFREQIVETVTYHQDMGFENIPEQTQKRIIERISAALVGKGIVLDSKLIYEYMISTDAVFIKNKKSGLISITPDSLARLMDSLSFIIPLKGKKP